MVFISSLMRLKFIKWNTALHSFLHRNNAVLNALVNGSGQEDITSVRDTN